MYKESASEVRAIFEPELSLEGQIQTLKVLFIDSGFPADLTRSNSFANCKLTITITTYHQEPLGNSGSVNKAIEMKLMTALSTAVDKSDGSIFSPDTALNVESFPSYPKSDPRFRIFQLQRKFSDVVSIWFNNSNWSKRRSGFVKRKINQMADDYKKKSKHCDFGLDSRADDR